jgi:DNA invertase Pin-like site-specific DNA recombinase
MRAVAYLRVSTTEQTDSGAGLAAQRASIEAEVGRRGWVLVESFTDSAASGKSLVGREALAAALAAVEAGHAETLVVAKLDRLSRSLLDFASLMARAQAKGWNLVALDLGIDLSTPAGEFLASVMASAAQWERRIIGVRTREAMAAKKAAGVRLGRPRLVSDAVCQRIQQLRDQDLSWQKVSDLLNEEQVPTGQGRGRWYPASARTALVAYERDRDHVRLHPRPEPPRVVDLMDLRVEIYPNAGGDLPE